MIDRLPAELFRHRVAVLATMHQKEEAIAPILEAAFRLRVAVPAGLNTDRFGTFTRDVERPADQRTTARLKAEAALALTGETLAIASEGSFGPHPALPYLPCNRELVLLIDRQHQLEVVGEELTTETNYRQGEVRSLEAARDFAQEVGFPRHGLVVATATGEIVKGITDASQLSEQVSAALRQAGKVRLETDMRALYNPTRMLAIARATHNLVQKLQQTCPQCAAPGFDIVEQKRGLPCALCRLPTSLPRSAVYQCQRCQFTQEVWFPNGAETADPTYCSYCNP